MGKIPGLESNSQGLRGTFQILGNLDSGEFFQVSENRESEEIYQKSRNLTSREFLRSRELIISKTSASFEGRKFPRTYREILRVENILTIFSPQNFSVVGQRKNSYFSHLGKKGDDTKEYLMM